MFRLMALGIASVGLLLPSVALGQQQTTVIENFSSPRCMRLQREMESINRLLPRYYRTGYAPDGRNPHKEFFAVLALINEYCFIQVKQNTQQPQTKQTVN